MRKLRFTLRECIGVSVFAGMLVYVNILILEYYPAKLEVGDVKFDEATEELVRSGQLISRLIFQIPISVLFFLGVVSIYFIAGAVTAVPAHEPSEEPDEPKK